MNSAKLASTGLAAAFAATLQAAPAQALVARTFLSAAGSDSNNCANVATPCRHLAAAYAVTAPNGEIYVKLGESYWINGQTDQAIDAFTKGLAKGGIKDMADAQTTLGIIYMDAGKSAEAAEAFKKAEAAGGTGASVAHAWNLFVNRTA